MRTYYDNDLRSTGASFSIVGSLVIGLGILVWVAIRLAFGIVWLLVKAIVWAISAMSRYTRKHVAAFYLCK
jgi:uncharacterized membrane protein